MYTRYAYIRAMKTFRDLIDKWESVASFARDLGVRYTTAASMYDRNSVGSTHWPALKRAARRRGFTDIADETLARLAAGCPADREIGDEASHAA